MNENLVRNKVSNAKSLFVLIFSVLLSVILLLKQSAVREALDISIKLCLSSIIPAIFPFMILSDFLMCNIKIEDESKISKLFSRITGIKGSGAMAFVLGNICGFPIGAHISTELYNGGNISDEEYKRLLPISTNPSLAFVVSGVGMGIRGSIADGIKLYISIVFATIISSVIWKSHKSAECFSVKIKEREFSLVGSIKNAMSSLISVFAYIFFFSIIVNIIYSFSPSRLATALVSAILEIGNACSNIYTVNFPQHLSLSITAFALGFSGLSMYVQALGLAESLVKQDMYIKIKLTEGIFAFAIALLLSII